MTSRTRHGTLLIVVAGAVAVMAALCLSFLVKARGEAEETELVMRHTQCRIALAGACAYVQESSRIGYDLPGTPVHEEAFGWVDVRDGQIGPKTWDFSGDGVYDLCYDPAAKDAMNRPQWPAVGGVTRQPMIPMVRPPWAISSATTPNEIESNPTKPLFGIPLLTRPDPQPQLAVTGSPSLIQRWEDFKTGDTRPRSIQRGGWFRLRRDGPATFVITCGSGATLGFRDWAEVVGLGAAATFGADQSFFESLVESEQRLWYRIEWSSAIAISEATNADNLAFFPGLDWKRDHADWIPYNEDTRIFRIAVRTVNQGGTIQWIQRLRAPPEEW